MKTGTRLLRFVPYGMLALSMAFGLFRAYRYEGYTDFNVYYGAGKKFLLVLQGHSVDFATKAGESSPFRYSPLIGFLLLPFAIVPLQWARVGWVFLQWCFYFLGLQAVKKRLGLDAWAFCVLVLGTLRFAIDNSNIGQIAALEMLLLLGTVFAEGGKSFLSFGLSALIKPQSLPLIGVYLFSEGLRSFWQACFLLATLIVASLCFGAAPFSEWLHLLTRAPEVLDPAIVGNQSFYGVCLRVMGDINGKVAFLILLAASSGWCFYSWKKSRFSSLKGWVMGFCAIPIFGILTWKNTYLLVMLPLAWGLKSRDRALVAGISILYLLCSQGIVGSTLNGLLLHYGALPLTTLCLLFLTTRWHYGEKLS